MHLLVHAMYGQIIIVCHLSLWSRSQDTFDPRIHITIHIELLFHKVMQSMQQIGATSST